MVTTGDAVTGVRPTLARSESGHEHALPHRHRSRLWLHTSHDLYGLWTHPGPYRERITISDQSPFIDH
jgi:hypothetical protein